MLNYSQVSTLSRQRINTSVRGKVYALTHLFTLLVLEPLAYAGGSVIRAWSIMRAALVK